MAIQLVGAGVGRTGTHSLKLALEFLLGGNCHHMVEMTKEQVPIWTDAFAGSAPDWPEVLSPYCAIVDWPGAGMWRELAAAFPEAPVLLSTRSSTDVWYESASNTIFKSMIDMRADSSRAPFVNGFMTAFSKDWRQPESAKAAYEAHNEAVRATIPADRLFEYQPGDGWGPLCAALDLPEPDMDFPHTNSTADFIERFEAGRSN